jgi:hypothetical protein
MNKPPAFQFYAKDWLSSSTVRAMSMRHRGVYITVLAAMWDSDEPGTLPLPLEVAARSAGLDPRSLRDFVSKSPRCLIEVDGKLVNEKLREQWEKLMQFKQTQADAARRTNEKLGRKPSVSDSVSERSALAFAFASAKEGASLMQLSQDHAGTKRQEPVPMRSQIDKAIGKIADKMKPSSATSGQRAHLEAGIFRKKIEAAYFDATRAKMKPDDCIREAIEAGALSLVTNRSVELRGLDRKDLSGNAWERIRNGIAALHEIKSFDQRSKHVVAVVTHCLTSIAMESWERAGAEANAENVASSG